MNLPYYVKPYSKLFHDSNARGFTSFILRRIYLPKETFEDLKSNKPSLQNVAILKHEEIHLNASKRNNVLKYAFKYYLSRKFRLEEELSAYREQFKYLKRHNLSYDLKRVAHNLSSKGYRHTTSYKKAKFLVDQAWQDA